MKKSFALASILLAALVVSGYVITSPDSFDWYTGTNLTPTMHADTSGTVTLGSGTTAGASNVKGSGLILNGPASAPTTLDVAPGALGTGVAVVRGFNGATPKAFTISNLGATTTVATTDLGTVATYGATDMKLSAPLTLVGKLLQWDGTTTASVFTLASAATAAADSTYLPFLYNPNYPSASASSRATVLMGTSSASLAMGIGQNVSGSLVIGKASTAANATKGILDTNLVTVSTAGAVNIGAGALTVGGGITNNGAAGSGNTLHSCRVATSVASSGSNNFVSISCNAGEVVFGGCNASSAITGGFPSNLTTYNCNATNAGVSAYAICCAL